ncbi:ABC transporter substrate-binding protein [Pseudarthrobacter sp. YAF2]|uniref:ABC transporter substrate-binding protein n=1 Tax=Pseudarthrobacter sp. YAF2 TaxID=3233078 RepID=UPI003F99EDD2
MKVSPHRRGIVSGATMILIASLLSACGGGAQPASTSAAQSIEAKDSANLPSDWAKVVDEANKEGEVIFYTTLPNDQATKMIAGFNTVYPNIKVRIVTDATASLANRYQQERTSSGGNSPADILHSSSFEALVAAQQDWFHDLRGEKDFLPSLADFKENATTEERKRTVLVAAYPWQVLVNTNKVQGSAEPTSFKDLTKDEFKDKLIMSDPRTTDYFVAFYNALAEKFGPEYLRGLAANQPKFVADANGVAQSVAAGEKAAGLPLNAGRTAALEAAKAPVKRITGDSAIIAGTTMAFPNKAPHENAARVFGNWLLSAEGQELGCDVQKVGSLNKLAKGACEKTEIPEGSTFQKFTVTSAVRDEVLGSLGLK